MKVKNKKRRSLVSLRVGLGEFARLRHRGCPWGGGRQGGLKGAAWPMSTHPLHQFHNGQHGEARRAAGGWGRHTCSNVVYIHVFGCLLSVPVRAFMRWASMSSFKGRQCDVEDNHGVPRGHDKLPAFGANIGQVTSSQVHLQPVASQPAFRYIRCLLIGLTCCWMNNISCETP